MDDDDRRWNIAINNFLLFLFSLRGFIFVTKMVVSYFNLYYLNLLNIFIKNNQTKWQSSKERNCSVDFFSSGIYMFIKWKRKCFQKQTENHSQMYCIGRNEFVYDWCVFIQIGCVVYVIGVHLLLCYTTFVLNCVYLFTLNWKTLVFGTILGTYFLKMAVFKYVDNIFFLINKLSINQMWNFHQSNVQWNVPFSQRKTYEKERRNGKIQNSIWKWSKKTKMVSQIESPCVAFIHRTNILHWWLRLFLLYLLHLDLVVIFVFFLNSSTNCLDLNQWFVCYMMQHMFAFWTQNKLPYKYLQLESV